MTWLLDFALIERGSLRAKLTQQKDRWMRSFPRHLNHRVTQIPSPRWIQCVWCPKATRDTAILLEEFGNTSYTPWRESKRRRQDTACDNYVPVEYTFFLCKFMYLQ